MVRLRERKNVALRSLRCVCCGRNDQGTHREPVHQAQHTVDMIVMRMREHEQVEAPVSLCEQLVRREITRILHSGAAAAVHHGAELSTGKHDALPLADIERRHG